VEVRNGWHALAQSAPTFIGCVEAKVFRGGESGTSGAAALSNSTQEATMPTQDRPLFSAGELLTFAWARTKENLRPLLIIGGVSMVFSLLNSAGSRPGQAAGFDLINLLVQLFQVAITMAWIRVSLEIADGKRVQVPRLADLWPDYFLFLITCVLTGIVVALGLIALIVPGVVLALTFSFAGFLVMDRSMNPIEAMRESARLTTGAKPDLFMLGLLLLALNVVGALALGVGLLVTVPMTFIAAAQVYRRLQEAAGHAPVSRGIAGPPAPIAH
jgi:hypothetical protein